MNQHLKVAVETAISLYRELHDDGVEMWFLAGYLRSDLPTSSESERQATAEVILHALLANGAVLGSWEANEPFTPWPNEGAVERVMREWRALGRDPDIGEIGWLVLEADSVEQPKDASK